MALQFLITNSTQVVLGTNMQCNVQYSIVNCFIVQFLLELHNKKSEFSTCFFYS